MQTYHGVIEIVYASPHFITVPNEFFDDRSTEILFLQPVQMQSVFNPYKCFNNQVMCHLDRYVFLNYNDY